MGFGYQNLKRLFELSRYNLDWPKYILHHYMPKNGGEPLRFRLRNGQTITLPADALFILNEIYIDRVYEISGIDMTCCGSFLDLGANVGAFALYAASRAPRASVYCFEPSSRNFPLLDDNLKRNAVPGQAFRMAVAGHCGTARLQLDGTSVGRSLVEGSEPGETVECVDLARALALTGREKVDFAKIDIEGAEMEMFAACSDENLRCLGAISLEWHYSVQKLDELAARLRDIGFDARRHVLEGNIRYLTARLA
ncbi:MAG TPA: FkbM family methyltransferase [Candidatus Solibacter sp.]|nr:FkbM family methyltransferase [Candidatus Solibacter sp.]